MAKSPAAFPELKTSRLRLRRFLASDLADAHTFFGDEEAMRFWNMPTCESPAETARILGWLMKTSSPYDHLSWAITAGREDRCIGMVNYHNRDARNGRAQIGYILRGDRQGHGLATEAVGALVGYCHGTLKVHRIEALIVPENVRSVRLVERLGFRCEGGPMRDYWRVGGAYRDALLHARLAGDGLPSPTGERPARARKSLRASRG